MKKQLQKSFIAFFIFNSTFLISANAQIVYTDVKPDVTYNTNGSYSLDLDNDSNFDFHLTDTNSFLGSCTMSPKFDKHADVFSANSNSFFGISNLYPSAMNSGALIDSSLIWITGNGKLRRQYKPYCGPVTSTGNWTSTNDNYLPVKLSLSGNNYFGWVRMQVYIAPPNNWLKMIIMIIKDYAYNSVPNYPILAGQTTCPPPTVTLSPSGSLSFCQGDNVTLTANGTGTQYQWKKNGVNISGATLQTYIAKTSGTYTVKVTNGCGLSQTSNSAIVTVGLPCKNSDASLSNAIDALEHLLVYPNPATNSVTIKIPSDDAGEIQMINLLGRVVETHNYASLRDGELQIDVSKFPVGMYVVRWRSGENYQAEKFSVMH